MANGVPSGKSISIVAGPNGSGKTTFAKSFLAKDKAVPVFLNPDLITAGIALAHGEQASFQAGRVLLADIKNRLAHGESFGFESTLSGKTYAGLLRGARDQGYSITIYFLLVNSIECSLQRIKRRVRQGGHDIPKTAVLRRRSRCLRNFWNLYRPLADDWYIFDNSGGSPALVESQTGFKALNSSAQSRFVRMFLKGKVHDRKRAPR